MKKQTTDETLPRKEVETLIDNVRTSTKASVLADVEKIIDDKCDDINSSLSIEFCKDERDINDKNARFGELKELMQEIAKLKENKWAITIFKMEM